MNSAPNLSDRRRWTRWSLRGLLLVMTMVGIWLGYQVNWISARRILALEHAERFEMRRHSHLAHVYRDPPRNQPLSVTLLNLLGESSRPMVLLVLWGQPASGGVDESAAAELQRAADLFPESAIGWVSGD